MNQQQPPAITRIDAGVYRLADGRTIQKRATTRYIWGIFSPGGTCLGSAPTLQAALDRIDARLAGRQVVER